MATVVSPKMGDAAVLELMTWVSSFGPVGMSDAVCVSWIVCITNGHVSVRGGGCMSRINTSSVGGDTYDKDVAIHRWWLIIVRGGIKTSGAVTL